MRNRLQNVQDRQGMCQRLPVKVAQGCEVMFSHQRKPSSNREDALIKIGLNRAHSVLGNSVGPQFNPCIVTMIIRLDVQNTLLGGRPHSATTCRRVLLDTGAEFNLISHRAFEDLNTRKVPFQGTVQSIGGCSELEGIVALPWHFSLPVTSAGQSSKHCAPFYILQEDSEPKFDCIIGRPWIMENWTEFIAMVETNSRHQAKANAT
ncbi:hypothetical protein PV11_07250 [Exophiala sideris]|uniref:Peptidase A2 domain-containing protein n=1 Tax=Exophiala sideris TaxID=1016849 RepID=A0A0D1YY03_9EURO|nr:hypothetical protein PV11_07250 [Exophiala sideris]